MQTVAILTTSRNQKDRVLSVLRSCSVQIDEMKNEENFSFTIYLLDNMSTDGTVEAVNEAYPQVKTLKMDMGDEWSNGLKTLWEYVAEKKYDFYLILDSGIHLEDGALACLMENSKFLKDRAIIAGTISDKDGKICLYGGLNKHGKVMVPDDILPLPCTTFDGKLVLVPNHVFQTIGNIDSLHVYRFPDYEYGRRAKRNGLNVVIAPRILGSDDREDCPDRDKFIYDLHHYGWIGAALHNLSIWMKLMFSRMKNKK